MINSARILPLNNTYMNNKEYGEQLNYIFGVDDFCSHLSKLSFDEQVRFLTKDTPHGISDEIVLELLAEMLDPSKAVFGLTIENIKEMCLQYLKDDPAFGEVNLVLVSSLELNAKAIVAPNKNYFIQFNRGLMIFPAVISQIMMKLDWWNLKTENERIPGSWHQLTLIALAVATNEFDVIAIDETLTSSIKKHAFNEKYIAAGGLMEVFFVLHEYAHIKLRHLDGDGSIELEQEMDADLFAINAMHAHLIPKNDEDIFLGYACMLLLFHDLVIKIQEMCLGFTPNPTHPTGIQRWNRIRSSFPNQAESNFLERLELFFELLSVQIVPIVKILMLKVATASEQRKDFLRAQKFYQYLIRIAGEAPKVLHRLGLTHYSLNQYQQAMECLDRSLLLYQYDPDVWYDKGLFLANSNNLISAIVAFDKAIELDDLFEKAYVNRATVFLQNGTCDLAIRDLKKAIQLDPLDSLAFLNLGAAYLMLKKYKKARGYLETAKKFGNSQVINLADHMIISIKENLK